MKKLFENFRRYINEAKTVEMPESAWNAFEGERDYYEYRSIELGLTDNEYHQIFLSKTLFGPPVILDLATFDTSSLQGFDASHIQPDPKKPGREVEKADPDPRSEATVFHEKVELGWVKLCSNKPSKEFIMPWTGKKFKYGSCKDLKKAHNPVKTKDDLYKNKRSIKNLKMEGYEVVWPQDIADRINFNDWLVQSTLEDKINEINTGQLDSDEPLWIQIRSGKKERAAFVMTVSEIQDAYKSELAAARGIFDKSSIFK